MATSYIILTAASASPWVVPANCTTATVQTVGAGSGGASGHATSAGGAGGGGGAFASSVVTLTPGASIPFVIGLGSSGGTGTADGIDLTLGQSVAGGDTLFGGTSLGACTVGAQGARGTVYNSGSTGGLASASVGTTKYNGGSGQQAVVGSCGGGGGAGPLGAGGNGGIGISGDAAGTGGGGNGGGSTGASSGPWPTGGAGGANHAGSGAGSSGTTGSASAGSNGGGGGGGGVTTTSAAAAGGTGGAGTDLSGGIVGSGGGGGGGGIWNGTGSVPAGGAGGNFGGGGGGGAMDSTIVNWGSGGPGANGVIVISYTPVGDPISTTISATGSVSTAIKGGGRLSTAVSGTAGVSATTAGKGALSTTIAGSALATLFLVGAVSLGSFSAAASASVSTNLISTTNTSLATSISGSGSTTLFLSGLAPLSTTAPASASPIFNIGTKDSVYTTIVGASNVSTSLKGIGSLSTNISASGITGTYLVDEVSYISPTSIAASGSVSTTMSYSTTMLTRASAQANVTTTLIATFTPEAPPATVEPVGFDYTQTIISQFSNSPVLTKLLANFDQYIDPTVNIQAFYSLVWNIDTARGYGLDVWGRIVGIGRVLHVQSATSKFFGFVEATTISADPFGQSPFYSAGTGATGNFSLSDMGYRKLILAKALANISDGSIKSINQILINLFPGRGNCYVTDGLNMTMTYTFDFPLTLNEVAIVSGSGVLPRPAGVSAALVLNAGTTTDLLGEFVIGTSLID